MKIINEKMQAIRQGILDNTIDEFSKESIGKRKKWNFLLRNLFKVAIISKRPKVINKPKIEKDKKYIFASMHSYEDDVITNICCTKKNMYLLMGGTDQVKTNPLSPITALNGVIRIDILDKKSRLETPKIIEKVLEHTNILMYPEGAYCDSENRLHEGFYESIYEISKKKKVEVIPLANFYDLDKKRTFIMYGDPMSGVDMTKDEFMSKYSESISSMVFHIMSKYCDVLKKQDLINKYGDNYLTAATKNYFEKRYNCYAGDDTELGWIENFYYKKDLDQYHSSEFAKLRASLHKKEEILPNSELFKEVEYYHNHDFKEFVKNKTNFEIKDPLKDPIFILTRKLKKLFKTKDEIVTYLLNSSLSLNEEEFNKIKDYIYKETSELDLEDTVNYVINEILSISYQFDEVMSNIDKALTLSYTKYQR